MCPSAPKRGLPTVFPAPCRSVLLRSLPERVLPALCLTPCTSVLLRSLPERVLPALCLTPCPSVLLRSLPERVLPALCLTPCTSVLLRSLPERVLPALCLKTCCRCSCARAMPSLPTTMGSWRRMTSLRALPTTVSAPPPRKSVARNSPALTCAAQCHDNCMLHSVITMARAAGGGGGALKQWRRLCRHWRVSNMRALVSLVSLRRCHNSARAVHFGSGGGCSKAAGGQGLCAARSQHAACAIAGVCAP